MYLNADNVVDVAADALIFRLFDVKLFAEGSGSGKSTSCVIPTIIANPEISKFVLDIKGELSRIAEPLDRNYSRVFNPSDRKTYGYNPLYMLHEDSTTQEILEAMQESIAEIVEAVKTTLEKTPPELAADISDRGIYMTGGGCLVDGLDKLLQEKTGINVMIANDAVSCVALGTGKALDNLDALEGKR